MRPWLIDMAGFTGAALLVAAAWRYDSIAGMAVAGAALLTIALAQTRAAVVRSKPRGDS